MRNFFDDCIWDFEDEFWGITWCIIIFGLFTLIMGAVKSGAHEAKAWFTISNAIQGLEVDGFIISIILAFVLLVAIIVAVQELLKRAF